MTTIEELRVDVTQRICVSLAGRIAENRSYLPRFNPEGYLRAALSRELRNAFHEAAHVVIGALSYGWAVDYVTVIPDRTKLVGRSSYADAHVRWAPRGVSDEPTDTTPRQPRPLRTDVQEAAMRALLIADPMNWKGIRAVFRAIRPQVEN